MKYCLVLMAMIVAVTATADNTTDEVSKDAATVEVQLSEGATPELQLTAIEQLIENREYRDAVRKLKPLAKSNENDPQIWQLLGVALLKKGDYLGSKVAFEKSLKLDAENGQTLSLQAELFIGIGDRESARSNLHKLDAICPNGCEARDQVAIALDLL